MSNSWICRILAAAIVFLGMIRPGYAWCGATDGENWREFYSLWGADISRGPNRPLLFVIGAPWCPYCADLLRAYRSKSYSFDLRFVPKDAINDLHRNQLADIVVDGSVGSIVRVFEQRRADTSKISPQVHKHVNDVQLTMLNGLASRFATPDKPMGSPTVFFLTNQGIRFFSGMPNLEQIDKLILPDGFPVSRHSSRRLMNAVMPKGVLIDGFPFARQNNVRLRLLPDLNGFSVACLSQGKGYRKPVELIEVDGIQWLVFKNLFAGGANTTLYGRASDFGGWNNR